MLTHNRSTVCYATSNIQYFMRSPQPTCPYLAVIPPTQHVLPFSPHHTTASPVIPSMSHLHRRAKTLRRCRTMFQIHGSIPSPRIHARARPIPRDTHQSPLPPRLTTHVTPSTNPNHSNIPQIYAQANPFPNASGRLPQKSHTVGRVQATHKVVCGGRAGVS